jgi:hypothetical protein
VPLPADRVILGLSIHSEMVRWVAAATPDRLVIAMHSGGGVAGVVLVEVERGQ